MARQYLSSDSSPWTYGFGSGVDGAYAPSTSTDVPIDSTAVGTISTTSLTATNASFQAGQALLIHQTQGAGAGQWELNRIESYAAGTITLSLPLQFGYVTGAQVLVLKQYSSVNIAVGVTLTAKEWNGTVGGILAFLCNGTVTVTGTITATSTGFRGGSENNNSGILGDSGEGTVGASVVNSSSVNGNGGGGGKTAGGPVPGGGGNGAAGGGTNPGAAVGSANLTTMALGGGGGGQGIDNPQGSATSAPGGGIILVIGKTITITGAILSSGGNASVSGLGVAGSGAGGSNLLKGQTITLGTSLITANGGTTSSTGGTGRIHIDYSGTFSGTTSPALDSFKDSIYTNSGGAAAFLLL